MGRRIEPLFESSVFQCRYCPPKYHIGVYHHSQTPVLQDFSAIKAAWRLYEDSSVVVVFTWYIDCGKVQGTDEAEWTALTRKVSSQDPLTPYKHKAIVDGEYFRGAGGYAEYISFDDDLIHLARGNPTLRDC